MRITFARHGESEANVLHVFSNMGCQHGLTARGRVQARELAERLADQGISRIYSSPLLRARETAEIVGQRLSLPFEVENALVEFDVGGLEGQSDAEAWDEYEAVEREWLVLGNLDARVAGGECFLDIAARFQPFLDRLARQFGDTSEHILAISHGGTLACGLSHALCNVDSRFVTEHPIWQTSCIEVAYEQGRFECLRWGDVRLDESDDTRP